MAIGCASPDAQLAGHREATTSLTATAEAIGEAWLQGDVSETYAHVALKRTLRLIEDDRRSLALAPRLLSDPQGAAVAARADELSRAVARLSHAIGTGDVGGVRSLLANAVLQKSAKR
jgi:hypothetical protein